ALLIVTTPLPTEFVDDFRFVFATNPKYITKGFGHGKGGENDERYYLYKRVSRLVHQ
ncbi:MAG: hypothetical protein HQM16_06425, partial [Deltaproteobacteria bacterium]|nr:hypothetical protein [Deltaproteobacteria bacterium]